MAFGAQRLEVLQEADAERRLDRPGGGADNARERALEFDIVCNAEK